MWAAVAGITEPIGALIGYAVYKTGHMNDIAMGIIMGLVSLGSMRMRSCRTSAACSFMRCAAAAACRVLHPLMWCSCTFLAQRLQQLDTYIQSMGQCLGGSHQSIWPYCAVAADTIAAACV